MSRIDRRGFLTSPNTAAIGVSRRNLYGTNLKHGTPVYSYKLKDGVSYKRLEILILEKEDNCILNRN